MFDGCQPPVGPKCAEMAVEKISQIFGWRHRSYKVEKLQRTLPAEVTATPVNNAPSDAWVSVKALRSQSGGGILDPDDLLSDVADDRETIVAAYHEEDGGVVVGAGDGAEADGEEDGRGERLPHAHHGGGDGASGSSSVGTSSPDMFTDGDHKYLVTPSKPLSASRSRPTTDIEVTGSDLANTPQLQVRRGSEPTLNQLLLDEGVSGGDSKDNGQKPSVSHHLHPQSKRWSAAAPVGLGDSPKKEIPEELNLPDQASGSSGNMYNSWDSRRNVLQEGREGEEDGHGRCKTGSVQRAGVGGSQRSSAFTRFVRDSNRLSVQFLGDSPGGWKWAEAAERAASGVSPAAGVGRREPLGAPHYPSPTPSPKLPVVSGVPSSDPEDDLTSSDELEFVSMRNESGPLGIHVVPDYDRLGKDRGLLVQGIEPGGRIDRDGRLAIYDRIIEINGENLLDMPFHRVQEIFKNSLKAPELQLRVVKHRSSVGAPKKPPPPVFPKSISREQINSPTSPQGISSEKQKLKTREGRDEKENGMVEAEERLVSADTKLATVSPTKKLPQAVSGARNTNSLLHANTRKIGKKFEIELVKGPHGLGFSITTRDNPAGGNCPIYIKNILPKGAAVEDGRLKPGDRLLEVNGVEMTGKSQSEAVAILRNAPQGSRVLLVVSRQQVERTSPTGAATSPASNDSVSDELSSSKDEVKNNRSMSPQLPRKLDFAAPAGRTQDERKRRNNEPPEKVNDDSLLFPWKQREIITFDIPVHDTEKAGLGVSVKGKTTCSDTGRPVDLGIFVKSVIHGGAASRDGRLRTNDQLVDVNGVSLLGCSNSDAMETLRRVMMMSEGPKPGVITLTVARRVPTPGESGRDSVSSLLTNSSGAETFGAKSESESQTPEHSGASENSDNTVIFLPCNEGKSNEAGREYVDSPLEDNLNMKSTYSSKLEDKNLGDLEAMTSRNPVIDRLTGQSALRNESYYRATNDTWSASMLMSVGEKGPSGSPTVNCPSGEMVLIEEEYLPSHHHHHHHPKLQNKHGGKSQIAVQNNQHLGPVDSQRQDLQRERHGEFQGGAGQNGSDITYESQTSLEEVDAAGFSRDAFGRQSMSEKRHATLDAKNTDTYQRNKRLREERERQRQMQMEQQEMNENKRVESEGNELRKHDLGPSLGMKKSSSLESLQTMVQEIQMQEDPENPYSYHHHGAGTINGGGGSSRVVVRGRGCNESFRAAVDRSYEAPLGLAEFRSRMETLAEEDNDGPGGMNRVGSDRGGGPAPSGPFLMRGSSRQSSLGAEGISKKGIRDKQSKKGSASSSTGSGGILKGIGSMFRFGKHRKTVEIPTQVVHEKEADEAMGEDGVENPVDVPGVQGRSVKEGSTNERVADSREREREQARLEAQEEQQRIQEQYRRLMQRQRQIEQQQQQSERDMGPPEGGDLPYHHPMHGQQQGHHGVDGGLDGGSSRAERIQQLRAQHQRRHAERRGQYPMDDREERYEEAIRQSLDHNLDSIGNERIRNRPPQVHQGDGYDGVHYGRGGSSVIRLVDDIRGSEVVSTDMEGGSHPESGMGPPSDPTQFSHYVNYEEIQQHLSRRQQHYHSQRRDNRDSPFHHARPVSNFYEYESVLQGTGGAIGHQHNHHQLLMRRQVVAEENMRQVGVAWQQPQRVEGGSLPKRLGGTGGSVGRISGGNYLQPRIYQPASAANSALKSQGYSMGASQRSSGMQHHPMQSPQKHDGRLYQSSHVHHSRTGSSGLMGHSQQSSWRGPYVSTTRIRPTESSPPGSKV